MSAPRIEDRVLLYAPVGKDAELTCRVLRSADITCLPCKYASALMAELQDGAACLLLAEEAITPGLTAQLGQYIEHQPHWSDLPILLLTSAGISSPTLNSPIQTFGNVTLLERPVRTLALISAVGSALRARKRQYGLREAEARKDEFLASLGHELRNPLAPIRTSVAILKQLYPDAPQIGRITAIVERQVTHLTRLVDDLLDVARITRGKVVLQPAPTSLNAVIDHALEMCAVLAVNAGHQITVDRPVDDVPLIADHARLVQAIANVLANAIKFTPRGGAIALIADADDKLVSVRVRDTGIGLEPQALSRIFELFEQSEAGDGQIKGGLGIGLSLARQFMQMHGGGIEASSEGPGKGSEFLITIPRGPIDPAQAAKVAARQAIATARADAKATRVLVVDDNRDAADMLEFLFNSQGFEVTAAYNGAEASEAAARFLPDAVVMDLGMPGVDGFEAARRIRNLPQGRHMVLIALTGWGQEGTRKKALEAGFDYHVVKPVDIEVLKEFIAQH